MQADNVAENIEAVELLVEAFKNNDLEEFNKNIHSLTDLEYKTDKGWTLLIIAAFSHSYAIAERLIELGADVNACNDKGTTVLMYAKTKVKHNKNLAFLDYLISKGASVSAKDIFGKTVIDYLNEPEDKFLKQYFESKLIAENYGG